MSSQTSSAPTKLDSNITTVMASCEKHGEYEASSIRLPFGSKPFTSSCPACSAEARARDEERERVQTKRKQEQRIASLFGRSGIPQRFIDRTLDSFQVTTDGQKRAAKICERYVEGFDEGVKRGTSLVFAGAPGTGKTHLACGIASALIQKLHTVQFMTILKALRHIKDTYRRDSERSESDAIDDMIAPDLLILDEIGVQLGSEHEKMLMFEIINERYQQCRATILISNLTGDELTGFLGDRVMDRFREAGAVIAFDWASHRGQRPSA